MILTLDWPSKDLSPNGRLHYHALAKAKAHAREVAGWLARSQPIFVPEGNIPISIVFYPPTRARYDLDGLLSRLKANLDGLADGWGVDDVRFRPITIDMGEVIKGGKVEIIVQG
jgi:crossover junction endodeoxyribonuclease RusA